MKNRVIKVKKIESTLVHQVKDIYKKQLKHNLQDVSCKILARTVILTLEGIVTSPEKILKNSDRLDLAKQMRQVIDAVINSQIKDLIEEVMPVKVIDFLSDTTLEHNLTGIIAIFEFKSQDT